MTINKLRRIGTYVLAGIGTTTILLLLVGAVADVLAFDQTRGGYDAPYTDYSGEPIDWDEKLVSPDGMYSPGYVIDTHVDCTSGMISFEFFGISVDYRELSPRALAVHEPRQACEEREFQPDF